MTDIYRMKSNKHFASTLQDNIRNQGVINEVSSDRVQVRVNNCTQDVLRVLFIDD